MHRIFPSTTKHISSLSLLCSLAIIRTFNSLGLTNIAIKWPNDIIYNDKKIAGILIESWINSSGFFVVVIGIGINCKLSPAIRNSIETEVGDLHEITGKLWDRNQVIAVLLNELFALLQEFERAGFFPFIQEWIDYHAYHEKPVKLIKPDNSETFGMVTGVNEDGSINLLTETGIESFVVGEISMRPSC